MKARACALLALLLMLLSCCALSEGEGVVYRALLLGCDRFVSHEETTPSAALNVGRMARMLETDKRGYASITRMDSGVSSTDRLRSALGSAFAGADDDDVSLVYFCTHGLYDRITSVPSLVLSDGSKEETISAQYLRSLLDMIPGHKILLLDACNSGAFIGKGAWDDSLGNAFAGGDYSVLTSAGASEISFLWRSKNTSEGGSYFAAELCDGLRSHAYDLNADGVITVSEVYEGLLENHGASTVQSYPQDDPFPLYVYDPAVPAEQEGPLSDFVLDTALLDDGEDTLYFSFTVRRPVRVQYQIIYYRAGEWRFNTPQIIEDVENSEGALLPGRKERSVTLSSGEDASGYVLLQLVVQEGRYAMLAGSRLITVQPNEGDPRLRIWMSEPSFNARSGEEMGIYVRHSFPCSLTVKVLNEAGETVRRLGYKSPSRPLGQMQEGSYFYWDGKDDDGNYAPSGAYRVQVSCTVGGEKYERTSGYISLTN